MLPDPAQAEYLAESGINLAMYYLQNPDKAPALNAAGYWGGTTSNIALGDGTVGVTVTQDSSDSSMYEVTSIGAVGDAGTTGDTQMIRTEYARLNVLSEYELKYATGINASATFNGYTTVTGDAIVNGFATLKAPYAHLTGTLLCYGYSNSSTYPVSAKSLPSGAIPSPTNSDINLYQTYTSGSSTYSADPLPGNATTLTGTAGVTTLSSTSTNPAGIWYSAGNLTLYDNVTINGTLVVNGSLTVSGANITINPTTGYPGLIVTGNMQINQTLKSITVNGVCYVGGQLKSSGLYLRASDSSILNVNGGLLIGGSGMSSSYNVTTNVQLDPTMSKAPDLSSAGRTPVGIKVVRWGPVVAAPY